MYKAKYVTTEETIGVIMNGTAMIGFITIGVAKTIGSLILKTAGPIESRPNWRTELIWQNHEHD